MIAKLLNYKKTAIVIGLCLTLFTVQALRIKSLKTGKAEVELELAEAEQTISEFESAEITNLEARKKLEETNQQCVLGKEINASNSKLELTRQQGRIADIKDKYEKLRKENMQKKGCYPVRIDPDLLDQLYENKIHNQD